MLVLEHFAMDWHSSCVPAWHELRYRLSADIFFPVLVAFSSFATAALTSDVPLTSDKIFPSISLFMLLQFPLAMVSLSLHSRRCRVLNYNHSSAKLHRTSSKRLFPSIVCLPSSTQTSSSPMLVRLSRRSPSSRLETR